MEYRIQNTEYRIKELGNEKLLLIVFIIMICYLPYSIFYILYSQIIST